MMNALLNSKIMIQIFILCFDTALFFVSSFAFVLMNLEFLISFHIGYFLIIFSKSGNFMFINGGFLIVLTSLGGIAMCIVHILFMLGEKCLFETVIGIMSFINLAIILFFTFILLVLSHVWLIMDLCFDCKCICCCRKKPI